ncbi:MAG: MobA/MobL family protein [Gallionella sp.]|nr:MobA/MobL family protein [Gallionella sp.]
MASYHLTIKNGKKGTAAKHAAYIARQEILSKHEDPPDLIAFAHGNLPAWANGDPLYFFKMSDAGERANGAAYRELEIALPYELTEEQQYELACELVKQQIGEKPYFFAIHCPMAALGDVPQVHMHAMWSDRMNDGIERPPEQFFNRYNSGKPELGGCKKDSGGKAPALMKEDIKTRRANCADLQNKTLEQYGHQARVDHRSYRDRGIVKDVEKHLGAAAIKKLNEEEKAQIKDRRQKAQPQSA